MNLADYRTVYVSVCVVLGLIILTPTLAYVVSFPGERFSELWLLGPNQLAEDYPFNVTVGQVNRVYLGVTNHMGDLEYYRIYVKFRNQTDSMPDTVNGTPSSLGSVGEYAVFLSDNETWQRPVDFSIGAVDYYGNMSLVQSLVLDGYSVNVSKPILWDEQNNGFYGQLFFELWRFNVTSSAFEFDNRFVGLWLNVTQSV